MYKGLSLRDVTVPLHTDYVGQMKRFHRDMYMHVLQHREVWMGMTSNHFKFKFH